MKVKTRAILIPILTLAAAFMVAFCVCRPTLADPKQTPVTPGELLIAGPNGQSAGACPLKHTDVDAQISGFIARVTVVQEFSNPTGEKIEAVYTFPLPEDAAVDRMEMKIGERLIVGEIHRREEARKIYDDAKAAGHVASLLDQERPNIFTQAVANIEPGAEVKITISYTQLLKYEAGTYKFFFPTVVGPRYMPGAPVGKEGAGTKLDTTEVPDASKISPPITPEGTRAGHDISIKVSINAGVTLQKATCETHATDMQFPDSTSAVITLQDKATIPNKDFVLNYQVAGKEIQSGLIVYAPENGNGGFFTLIMQPPMVPKQNQITPKEMVFVIDTSGSQQGEPIKKSKETMLYCIKNVNPGDTFNMIAFSNSLRKLFETAQPYNAENAAAAEKFLTECEAGGGTEMLPAVKAALEPAADLKRLRIVVFSTDGFIGNDMALIDCVQKNRGNARMFPFGIGSSVNRFLLEKMGEAGGGAAEIVLLNSDSKGIAEKFYNRIRSPLLTDITLDWHGLPITAEDMYPSIAPDLFASQPLILKGRYTSAAKGEITVQGRLGGRPWSETIQVELPAAEKNNDSLASIWARAKVEDLMDKDWLGAQIGKPNPNIKEDVIKVALEYNLMTQYTSFVAVDRSTVTGGGDAKTVAVPIEIPEGVSYEGVGGQSLNLQMTGSLNAAAAPSPRGATKFRLNYAEKSDVSADSAKVAGRPMPANKTVGAPRPVTKPKKGLTFADGSAKDSYTALKLDKTLSELAASYAKTGKSGKYAIPGKLVVKNGNVEVLIWAPNATAKQLAELAKLGLTGRTWVQAKKMIRGWVPIKNLKAIAALDFVTRMAPPTYSKK
ncbi:MAG: VIT and VWA domain-containing protein [Armatimonadetes bacterium]|nr:VIT and VWA domain-containing protein [Armatimonadota bacterium]